MARRSPADLFLASAPVVNFGDGQRPRTQGPPNRRLKGRALVGQPVHEPRLQDGDLAGQVDV